MRVLHGDCRAVLPTMAADTFDACVTDPPYEIGFMGRAWDRRGVAFDPATWADVLRVLKPGAHLLAFGGTRTFHRMAVAIEDAGFEIRDCVMWCYGTGFPKSHDVSKGIDKAAGAKRQVVGTKVYGDGHVQVSGESIGYGGSDPAVDRRNVTAPATPEAAQWQGWGTALKPAWEPVIVARKPLIGTVAENVLAHGTGALNIDGCRIGTTDDLNGGTYSGATLTDGASGSMSGPLHNAIGRAFEQPTGRWPANVIHDGSDEVLQAFGAYGERGASAPIKGTEPSVPAKGDVVYGFRRRVPGAFHADTGTAARFFYSAKASKADRAGSKHPTVKPIALMRYLCRLVTPPGGHVLDPFAGSGTTGQAAQMEGFAATLIEAEAEHVADIGRRMAQATPTQAAFL